jgi:hypothetical protein
MAAGRNNYFPLITLLVAGVLAIFIGLFVASGSRYLILLALAGLLSTYIVALPATIIVVLMAALVFVIAGSIMYFGGIGQALLLPYGLSLALIAKLVRFSGPRERRSVTAMHWAIGALVASAALSTVVNVPQPLLAMAGLKSLIGFVPVALLLASGALKDYWLVQFWRAVAFVPLLQLPYVLYQYFIVAARRSTSSVSGVSGSWDSVVGSFGGNPDGGGASGVLAFLVLACSFLAYELGRAGLLSRTWRLAIGLSGLICIVLAEVKVIILLLPVGMIAYFLPHIVRRPLRSIAAVLVSVVLAMAVILTYSMVHYAKRNKGTPTPVELYEYTFGYSTDPNYINFSTGEMGRSAALRLWWNDGMLRNPLHGVVGYGPGSSRGKSSFGVGEKAARYPFFIDRSAATQILWDFGLIGLVALLCLPVAAGLAAFGVARHQWDGALRPIMNVVPPVMAMAALMVPYSRDLLEVPALSFFFMSLLGTAMLVRRQYSSSSAASFVKAVGH